MKKLLSLILFSFIFFVNSYSQNEWTLANQEKGVSIYSKQIFCNAKQGFNRDLILFKIVNSTNTDLQISFKINRWINGECMNCNSNIKEDYRTFSVLSNQTIEGSCLNFRNNDLSLFVKFNDTNYKNSKPKVLTRYTIENFIIFE